MHEVNVGSSEDDFRVPGGALHRTIPRTVRNPTVPLAVENASSGEESWKKLPFYAAHDVAEVPTVDPAERHAHWLGLAGGGCRAVEHSGLVDLGPAALAHAIDCP